MTVPGGDADNADSSDVSRLRALTRRLIDAACAGDWEAAVTLEAERRPLLYAVFAQVEPGSHVRRRALLTEIIDADRQIMDRARASRAELSELLRQTGAGRAALKAYGANSM